MLYLSLVLIFVFLNVVSDVNYFIRTFVTVLWGRLFHSKRPLLDTVNFYSVGTHQDCDVTLKFVRTARLLRELDMARFLYYEVTGVYRRSLQFGVHSLQGSTLVHNHEPVPLYTPYKITTKLVYWDDRSVFLEHDVITLYDGKKRCLYLSRQYALSKDNVSLETLFKDLPGSEVTLTCPEYIKDWLRSMEKSSAKLRNV